MKATIDRHIAKTLYAHIFMTFRVCLFRFLFVCFKVCLYVCLIVGFSRVSRDAWNLDLVILFMPSRFIKLFYPLKQMSNHKQMVSDVTVNPMCVCVCGGGGFITVLTGTESKHVSHSIWKKMNKKTTTKVRCLHRSGSGSLVPLV